MNQTFKTEGTIKATLSKYKSQSGYFWAIEDEANACDSCLICNHYKYNHDNIAKNKSLFVHICLFKAPEFIDITGKIHIFGTLVDNLNTSCQHFLRRALL